MKNLFSLFWYNVSFFVLTSLILGCGGASTGNTNGMSDNGVVKFKMDGVNWVSGPPGHPDLKFEEEATTDGNTVIRIEAFAANGSHLALTVFKTSGIDSDTYSISDDRNVRFF